MYAAQHKLWDNVVHLVKTGEVIMPFTIFVPAFMSLATSSANIIYYAAYKILSSLLVTKDFSSTIVEDGTANSFFRPPQSMITTPPPEAGGEVKFMIVISPFEAQELLPDIEKCKAVTLRLYAPRMHQAYRPLDKLDLFAIGGPFDPQSLPLSLVIQLNPFSGHHTSALGNNTRRSAKSLN